jgi:putative NADPH-quinone reductase
MWPFKKTQLAGPEQFPAVIDALAEKLRNAGFVVEADRFHRLVHEFVATTSNELYAELHFALKKMDHEHRALPHDIAAEVRRLLKSIDRISRWR